VSLYTRIETHLLLLKNRLFVSEFFTVTGDLLLGALFVNQCFLVCDPTFLGLCNFVVDLLNLLLDTLLGIL
jgi:hypothetical protein